MQSGLLEVLILLHYLTVIIELDLEFVASIADGIFGCLSHLFIGVEKWLIEEIRACIFERVLRTEVMLRNVTLDQALK